MAENDTGYSIRVVAKRTGLSPHVIRMWEKRYQAVTPQRTETNRRVYSESDIERLYLLHKATEAGHAIRHVANLPIEKLREIVITDAGSASLMPATATSIAPAPAAADAEPSTFFDACLTAIDQFDAPALERTLLRASVALSQPALIDQVIAPLMQEIGARWQQGELRVAQEHLASGIIRTFLGGMRTGSPASAFAPHALVATPAGQMHEIGALMAAVTAISEGWQVTYLGPNLPAAEIALAAERKQARLVLLSLIFPTDDPYLADELIKLRELLPEGARIIAGGRAAGAYRDVLQQIEAIVLDDFRRLRKHLAEGK